MKKNLLFHFQNLNYFTIFLFAFLSTNLLGQSPMNSTEYSNDIRTSIKNDTSEVNRLLQLARNSDFTQNESAIQYANKALQISTNIDFNLGKVLAYRLLGGSYFVERSYNEALRCYIAGRNIALANNFSKELASFDLNTGNIFLVLEDYEEALKYYGSFVDYSQSVGHLNYLGQGLCNYGLCLVKTNPDSAYRSFIRAEKISEIISDTSIAIAAKINLGLILDRRNQFAEGKAKFETALYLSSRIGDLQRKAEALNGLSEASYGLRKLNDAEKFAMEAIVIADTINGDKILLESYNILADLHFELGNFKQSSETRKKHQQISDAFRLNNRQLVGNIYKEEALAKIELAEVKRKESELKAKNANKNQIILLLTALLLIGIVIIQRYRKRKLDVSNQLLKSETLRLHMSPHFIENSLANITAIESVSDMKRYLFNLRRLAARVFENQSVEFVSWNYEIDGLQWYLDMASLNFPRPIKLEVEFRNEIKKDRSFIPNHLIQNILANSVKSLQSAQRSRSDFIIKMTFEVVNFNVLLTIEDNGIGYSVGVKDTREEEKDRIGGLRITNDYLGLLEKMTKKQYAFHIEDITSQGNIEGCRVQLTLYYG